MATPPRSVNVRSGQPMPVTPLAPDTSAPVARWQRELAAAIRSPEALCAALDLDRSERLGGLRVRVRFDNAR